MALKAPYKITIYGTNEYYESDSNSEVDKVDIIAGSYESQDIDCFILRPFHRYDNEAAVGGGSIQIPNSIIYQKFEIVTTRLTNLENDYNDIETIYEDIISVIKKKYIFLEINQYLRDLHSAGKLIKGIITKFEPVVVPKRVYIEMEFEKERPQ